MAETKQGQPDQLPDTVRSKLKTTSYGRYGTEYEFRLLYRMLSRNLPYDLIAETFNITVTEVVQRVEYLTQHQSELLDGSLSGTELDEDRLHLFTLGDIEGMLLQLAHSSTSSVKDRVLAAGKVVDMRKDFPKMKQHHTEQVVRGGMVGMLFAPKLMHAESETCFIQHDGDE